MKPVASRATVVGSSAYDLERIGAIPEIPLEKPRHTPRGAVRPETETREQANQQLKQRARTRSRQGQYVSVFAVMGTVCVCALLFLVVCSYMQLSVLTAETAELETQLEKIKEDTSVLEAEYDSAFNLTEIEEYARNVLGMAEPAQGQTFYLQNSLEDKAVILDREGLKDYGVLSSITAFFNSIVE